MTDKLISDLGAIGAAIADTTVFEAQRSGQTTTEKAAGTDLTTYVGSKNLSYLADTGAARGNLGGVFPTYDPDFNDANIYLTTPSTSYAAGLMTANRLVMLPIVVPRNRTFTTYAVVSTVLAGTSSIHVALYNANSSLQPTTKVDEGAAIDTSTATGVIGRKTVAFGVNQALKPGLYFLAIWSDGAPTVIRVAGGVSPAMGVLFGTATLTVNSAKYRDTVSLSGGLLPADESAQAYTTMATGGQSAPVVGIR